MKIARIHSIDVKRGTVAATREARPAIAVERRPKDADPRRADDEELERTESCCGEEPETTEELSLDLDLSDVESPETRPSKVSDVYEVLEGDEPSQTLDVVF